MTRVRNIILFVFLMVIGLFVIGCASSVNPETGETLHSLDPNIIADLQKIGEAGSMVLGILGMVWPVLLPIAGYVGGAVRIAKKLTPQLTEAQVEAQLYHTAASVTVLGLEEFKEEYPKEWKELGRKLDELKSKIIKPEDRLKIENAIRGFRGLPPKVI